MDRLIQSFTKWLDENYTPVEYGDYRSRYDGACDMLRRAGLYVERAGAAIGMVRHTIHEESVGRNADD